MNGVLVIDKPTGWTSHDVVAKVRRITGERSIGHLGTLDPLATGVLPLLLGKMTRLAKFFSEGEKHYRGEIRFGFATTTYDAQGEATGPIQAVELDIERVRAAATQFLGKIQQVPPPYSAKKIGGVPAYKLARQNRPVDLKPVEVEVYSFEITAICGDVAVFDSRVKPGTYIRSVAHELGKVLGIGAHLSSLRRLRSGEFGVESAIALPELERALESGDIQNVFIPPQRILPSIPSVHAIDEQLTRIRHGNAVNLAEFSQAPLVKVFANGQDLVAIASRVAGTLFQPKVVLLEQ